MVSGSNPDRIISNDPNEGKEIARRSSVRYVENRNADNVTELRLQSGGGLDALKIAKIDFKGISAALKRRLRKAVKHNSLYPSGLINARGTAWCRTRVRCAPPLPFVCVYDE